MRGMPLKTLDCSKTQVTDLSPLEGMNLQRLVISPLKIRSGIDAIRAMKSLTTIVNGEYGGRSYSAVEFWKRYDAGEFKK